MYAQSRPMRLPEHYSGNAFRDIPPPDLAEQHVLPPHTQPPPTPADAPPALSPQEETESERVIPPSDVHRAPPSLQGLRLPMGGLSLSLGNEELLLLGLLLLLYSGGTGNEELLLCLVLLLLCGG